MAEPHERAHLRQREGEIRSAPPVARVRDDDLEPHGGLRYIAKLFKILALMLVFMIIAELIMAFQQAGTEAIGVIMFELMRLLIFAGFLWAAGDLAVLLIESNHDLRASRILLGRVSGKLDRLTGDAPPPEPDEIEAQGPAVRLRDAPVPPGDDPGRPG